MGINVSVGRMNPELETGRRRVIRIGWAASLCAAVSIVCTSNAVAFQKVQEPSQVSSVAVDLKMSELPGFAGYRRAALLSSKVGRSGRIGQVRWAEEGGVLRFRGPNGVQTIDLQTGKPSAIKLDDKRLAAKESKPDQAGVTRAKQRLWVNAPGNKLRAEYKNFNVQIVELKGGKRVTDTKVTAVTTDGNVKVRFGTCCWVYGEELDQQDAMWWSPDGKYLAFYRVSETHMKDYHLSVDNASKTYPTLETTRYPTAGESNPHVALLIYDLKSKKTAEIKIEGPVDQYIYGIQFTPDSKNLLFHRTGRRQAKMDVMTADVVTGKLRTVVTETQKTWQKNSPLMRFLADGQRFIWETEKTGFRHYELRSLDGRLLNPISKVGDYPCLDIVDVDEKSGWVYYSAYSSENPYNLQYHRARLDGTSAKRLTQKDLNHTMFNVSPDDKYFVATFEAADTPPASVLYSTDGKEVAVLAKSNGEVKAKNGLAHSEMFSYKAADGETTIYGILHKPAGFDATKSYPLIIDVYGGPESIGLVNRYTIGNPNCEFGFVIAKIANRGTINRGKVFESATYKDLGGPDLQDQADGVKFLSKRPYIDGTRVGIYGHSYGGYMSALALLRYPKIFHVGVSGAPVTDWKNYDTIYTERYMQTPQENRKGYSAGSCMKYSKNLNGRLIIIHGLKDDNVHPSNTWQLVDSLHKADKRFDMLIYPGFRHGIGSTYGRVRWEYFYKHLRPEVSGSAN